MSYFSSQGIVVADADFIHGDRIVFIDDGDHTKADQRSQGVACIEKSSSIGKILVGEQDLRHFDVDSLKRFFVCPHELALADRRRSLFHGEAFGVFLEA